MSYIICFNTTGSDSITYEVIYIGGMRRIFNLNSKVYRYDAMDLQTRLEGFKTVFRVNCHTTLNKYF